MELIEFKGQYYPKFQGTGFAARFAFPYAKEVCKGFGYDIGCNRLEWSFPESMPIDILLDNAYNATKLPLNADYIFSSHCLEHLENWVDVLDYWYTKLNEGGILFLYLPDFAQHYWRPWNNRKHKNIFTPDIIEEYMIDKGYKKIFKSGVDLNNSFMIYGQK